MNDSAVSPIAGSRSADPIVATPDALLRHWAERTPDAIALVDPADRARHGLGAPASFTFAQADRIASRLACHLVRLGLQPGDRLAVQLPNIAEGLLAVFGAWRAGLVVCPLPLLWRLSEVSDAFARIAPTAALTLARFGGHDHAIALRNAAAGQDSVRFLLGFGPGLPDGATPIQAWLTDDAADGAADGEGAPLPTNDDEAAAAATWAVLPSATLPVPRSHGELAALGRAGADVLQLSAHDAVLGAYPLSSLVGLAGLVMPWLTAGARLVLHQPFDFDVFLEQIERHRITYCAVPPAVIAALAQGEHLQGRARTLSRIGCVWSAAYESARPARAALSVPQYDIHALNDVALLMRARADGEAPSLLPLGRVPMGGGQERGHYAETSLRDNRDGTAALFVRGPAAPRTSVQMPQATAAPFLQPDADGWIATGIACVRTDGGYARRVTSDGIVQHGGASVAATELDRLYAEFPDFLDAAVFALDDPVMGQRIVAAVVPKPDVGLSLASLKDFLNRRQVAPYKLPEHLVIVRAIPRGPDGTVERDRLLSQL